ncbi:mannitol dehydrogenase family protein [Cupriavidus pauculus]|uniref:mannitol dehydrogenase family protein n=1 Tax=Cupriavidus pauculus TaxID=82633 RepID=UPI001EE2300B|nr:mannitol dehydrogenase family protein [Cupriavidus pauculus]GJG95578.1 mannitol dehydrogenase family protein [Cupriavidus pauculus]
MSDIEQLPRLHPGRLGALPADVRRPTYARDNLRAGIVHLGVGAFHRGHQAEITEAAIEAAGKVGDNDGLHWGIIGVSLRRPDTRDALKPQDGLYTLALRSASAETLQVIGAVLDVLVAEEDPEIVLDRIAHRDTHIVSLTVTEKGYCHDPATGELNRTDRGIVEDISGVSHPVTAIGYLAFGLRRRMERGLGPVTLLSCDNLASNGDTLRRVLLAFCADVDPALHDWVARCTFPNTMVDRIVPKTTIDDVAHVSRALGLYDAWPVIGEPFFQWVIEDRFAAGRPRWEAGGAQFVTDAKPFEVLKHRLVNGSQSMMAYMGVLAGWQTTDRVIAQPAVQAFISEAMARETQPTLPPLPGLDVDAYRASLLARFSNPALGHRTRQIAMDGSQKIPQRLLAPIRDRIAAGQPFTRLALGVAAWLHFLRGYDEAGNAFQVEDPLAQPLAAVMADAARQSEKLFDARTRERMRVQTITGFAPVFGDLGQSAVFVDNVAAQLELLCAHGVTGALSRVNEAA